MHSKYTVARGRGTYLMTVSLLHSARDRDGVLLATLVGADIETGSSEAGTLPEWTLRARHDTATDFEHDASSTADLTVVGPSAPWFQHGGAIEFSGVLTEARLYALGVDPLSQEDDDTSTGDCDGLAYDGTRSHDPHPFAPYLPPHVDGVGGSLVKVRCYPIRPWLVASTAAAPVSEHGGDALSTTTMTKG